MLFTDNSVARLHDIPGLVVRQMILLRYRTRRLILEMIYQGKKVGGRDGESCLELRSREGTIPYKWRVCDDGLALLWTAPAHPTTPASTIARYTFSAVKGGSLTRTPMAS